VTLAQTWQRGAWRIQASPNPMGATVDDSLSAVSCTSARACTAVGFDTADKSLAQAVRWNGRSWVQQSTPRVARSVSTGLAGVSCTSAQACVAVGSYVNAAFDEFTLAERWNGSRWVIQPTPPSRGPAGANAVLIAVSCSAAHFCIAVGSTGKGKALIEEWNGAHWVIKPAAPVPGSSGTWLTGVSCTSTLACTAVGGYGTKAGEKALAERWNGIGWTVQPAPNPAGATVTALAHVSCASSLACTAVGVSVRGPGGDRTLAENWNGHRWTIAPTPTPAAGGQLSDVSCTSAQSCTAVGNVFLTNGATLTLVETWNGSHWSAQAGRVLAGFDSGLSGVSCPAPGTCTAVGFYFGLTGFSLNLAIAT
jgi:hypothetical protein